jgi:hypothetical protein
MALSFGWRENDARESIWIGDPALGPIPPQAEAGWREDGDASWLEPHLIGGQPTRINFRNLTPDESRAVQGYFMESLGSIDGYMRAVLMCFRIAVSFEGMPDVMRDSSGVDHPVIVKERGIRMLGNGFVEKLNRDYPGMIDFYGGLILRASLPTDAEKKASSQPSTPTPSSEGASTAGTTEGSPPGPAA